MVGGMVEVSAAVVGGFWCKGSKATMTTGIDWGKQQSQKTLKKFQPASLNRIVSRKSQWKQL
jgi:hypothetical protein